MMRRAVGQIVWTLAVVLATGHHAQAQVEVGAHVSVVRPDQFDSTDAGVGGFVGWRLLPGVGVDAVFTLYPSEYPDGRAFSRRRVESLFGVTIGPRLGPLRPFAAFRAGALRIDEAPQPFPCILIYPPPLACSLAAGVTVTAFQLGGGMDLQLSRRSFLRVEAGDRVVRYPGPALVNGTFEDGSFLGHDFRVTAGAGLRF
jgi:hypothetical protein